MSHHLTVRIECHSHIRSLTGRVLNDMEHLRRMKEISARQLGQLAPFRIQVYLILAHNRQLSNWSNNNLCVQNYIISHKSPSNLSVVWAFVMQILLIFYQKTFTIQGFG